MKDSQILDLIDIEVEEWDLYGLLGQKLSTIRKKANLPPMYVVSSAVLRNLVKDDHLPEGAHIPWEVELDIAKRFDELDSQVVRLISSASYEYSLPPFSTAGSRSGLVVGIESLLRSYFEEDEVKIRERMGVHSFDVAVIVQKLDDAKASGRMTQSEKDTRIIAVHGFPVDLEEADSYIVNAEGEMTYHADAEQKIKWVLGENEIESVDIEENSWSAHKLTDKQVSRLARLGEDILELCGEEMAVDWYLVRNTFYVASLYPTKIVLVEI